MSEPVLVAGPVYERYRRGELRIEAPGFELRRARFESQPGSDDSIDDARWLANQSFEFPVFMPGSGAHRELLIILNGLNDSSYRKFFPWAASLARAGLPVAIFPSSFLMNRRPREWISPGATQRAVEARALVAADSVTPINAVLSHRVASDPRSLVRDALRTANDLRQLVTWVERGQLACEGDARRPFQRGTRCHFLGYSLGGYLALAVRLVDPAFAGSKVMTLCAGAAAGDGLNPVSPLIMDRHASALVMEEMAVMRSQLPQLPPLTAALLRLFSGTTPELRERVSALASDLTVLAGAGDGVVPAAGIASNLGRLDAVLPLGIHEYPFNLSAWDAPNLTREIARSHRVAPDFEAAFRQFLELALQRLHGDATLATPPAATTPHSGHRTQTSC